MSQRPVHELEARAQERWERESAYRATEQANAPAFYALVEFPFPSGEGLHVGHIRSYTALDAYARKKRMQGYNVLYPMGWDAFGLPTENYSIKTQTPPQVVTERNTSNFRRQLKALGMSFDWSREVNTTDPAYYKWTQWQFLQFLKNGLAYKATSTINWCPKCKIGLANEEAQGGVCERCGTPVEEREKEQWMLRITRYADRLISDLDHVDFLPKIRAQQVNWIGKSEGATVRFALHVPGQEPGAHTVDVFTTRPDTLFGVTFLVVSPELAKKWMKIGWSAPEAAVNYVEQALKQAEDVRVADTNKKTGVATGVMAIHPVTGHEIPVWVADYVLGNYGTGAIMAVPAHDARDYVFAKTFGLDVKRVVTHDDIGDEECIEEEGVAVNSDFLNGMTTEEAKREMFGWLEKSGLGRRTTTYKLRDWVFSRQRYWGEPIPLVKCAACATTKQKALLVHGFGGSPDFPTITNMKRALEQAGFEVVAPAISDAMQPDTQMWVRELLPHVQALGPDDIIVAHSLGAKMIVHALAEAKRHVRALFLLAPAIGPRTDADWDRYKTDRADVSETLIEAFKQCWAEPLPLREASAYADRKEVIWSTDDVRVPRPTRDVYGDDWYIHLTHGAKHFVSDQPNAELNETICSAKINGWIPLPESSLPLTLPPTEAYTPSDDGESPLAAITDWVNTTCPRCGGPATRETDTMPNWAGSSWYFLRYCDPHNAERFASPESLKQWMPVNLYNGGMEHTTLHLLYSRFWYKFLWDTGAIPESCGSEPYAARRSHGLVLAAGGEKMSKSKGNVVNPDDVLKTYGADVLRVYELFMGPFDQPVPWDMNGIEGVRRFLDKVWSVCEAPVVTATDEATTLYHQTLKKLTEGIEALQFNTCISQLMILTNAYQTLGGVPSEQRQGYVQMLAPFAPHLAEELWMNLGQTQSIHVSAWPSFDAAKTQSATFELVIQVNGKVRDRVTVASDIAEDEAKRVALASEKVRSALAGQEPNKVLYVPGRLVSIVV